MLWGKKAILKWSIVWKCVQFVIYCGWDGNEMVHSTNEQGIGENGNEGMSLNFIVILCHRAQNSWIFFP